MTNLEIVKIKIENLREVFKFLLLLLLAILIGEATLIFKILGGEVKFYFMVIILVGIVLIYFNIIGLKFIWNLMKKELNE